MRKFEIDVEANTGAVYQTALGLSVIATAGHCRQAAIQETIGYVLGGPDQDDRF